MKLLREPLIHFIVIGAAIYALFAVVAEPEISQDEKNIVVTSSEIEWMAATWLKRWGRLPDQSELDELVDSYVRDIVLSREAVSMGLDQNDSVIRRRLAQKLEFLARDMVAYPPPGDDELKSFFTAHADRYKSPATITFTQVYFDPELRNETTLTDAKAGKQALIAGNIAAEDAAGFGDHFVLQDYYPRKTDFDIKKLFGTEFSESIFELLPQQWQGPIESKYGTHLIYIHDLVEPVTPDFESVKQRVGRDWEQARREQQNNDFYTGLRDQYKVVIEAPAQQPVAGGQS